MEVIYTCPICGKDLRCVMLTSNPPQTRYECPACGWSFNEPRSDVMRIPFPDVNNAWRPTTTSYACKNCSNNPKNGGSGICDCTLGMISITC